MPLLLATAVAARWGYGIILSHAKSRRRKSFFLPRRREGANLIFSREGAKALSHAKARICRGGPVCLPAVGGMSCRCAAIQAAGVRRESYFFSREGAKARICLFLPRRRESYFFSREGAQARIFISPARREFVGAGLFVRPLLAACVWCQLMTGMNSILSI